MAGFLKDLLTRPKPTDTQIWECRPLAIEHAEDGIVYVQNTKVEFDPDPNDARLGRIKALTPYQGWHPELTITQYLELPQNATPTLRIRVGCMLVGTDDEGQNFTWHIDAAADQVLIDKERCEISYPCLPDITPEQLAFLNSDPVNELLGETWVCKPLVIIDDEGDVAYQGEASIIYTPVRSELQKAYLMANFVTEDGWRPTMHAVLARRKGLIAKDFEHNWNFRGYDEEGMPFTWLTGTEALDELVRREDHLVEIDPE